MRTSVVPSSGAKSPPHVVVIGNQKGGSGKSTFAMHIIVALLKAGQRVASFDLDLNQLTLTRYLGNRHEWDRKHEQKLELPDHYPVTEEVHGSALRRFISRLKKIGRVHKDNFIGSSALSHSADLGRFISQLKKIGRARKHDFIVIDTPGGVQHLSLIAHGMADTLITPINDSFLDLDVLVAMEQSDIEPQPSVYAKTVLRALEARRKVGGRATDWVVVRNRLESVEIKQSAPNQSGPGRDSKDTGFSHCAWSAGATRISRVFRRGFDGVRPGRGVHECCGVHPARVTRAS